MADRVGQQFGNYRLVQLLGQGDFTQVYLGKQVNLETLAAIKVFQTQLAKQDTKQFFLEARIMASVAYPSIVRILDFGIEEDTPYLVMDYVPHGTLRQRHPKGSRLPLATVVSYVNQIAPALQYAHERKLIHNHIKPENLLVGKAHEILLSDFGIALVDQRSRYLSLQDKVGTIAYMAPEQIDARPRPASDQYSLGIVVYEWLAGELPFQGQFLEIATKQRVMPPPPLREKFSDIAPGVETVVMKALVKRHDRRFADIQAFATALEQASKVEDIPTLYSIPTSQVPDATIPVQFPVQPLSGETASTGKPTSTSKNTPTMYSVPASQMFDATIPVQFPPQQRTGETVSTEKPASRGVSRRVVVSGLVGVAALGAVGGGIVWFSRRTASPVSPAINITPTPAQAETRRKLTHVWL